MRQKLVSRKNSTSSNLPWLRKHLLEGVLGDLMALIGLLLSALLCRRLSIQGVFLQSMIGFMLLQIFHVSTTSSHADAVEKLGRLNCSLDVLDSLLRRNFSLSFVKLQVLQCLLRVALISFVVIQKFLDLVHVMLELVEHFLFQLCLL